MIKNGINRNAYREAQASARLSFSINTKLEAKYFIIISAGFIDRRELLQIFISALIELSCTIWQSEEIN